MIQGFETYTAELDHYELNKLLPAIVAGMRNKIGEVNAITSTDAIKLMVQNGYRITAPRFRKILHVIRVSGMVSGICANSKGYSVAGTREEWVKYLTSISERAKHINSLRDALDRQYIEFKEQMK